MKKLLLIAAVAASGCASVAPGPYVPMPQRTPLVFYPIPTNNSQPAPQVQPGVVGYGMLVRQRFGQSPTGQSIMVCTYQYLGREFERGSQGYCPPTVPVGP